MACLLGALGNKVTGLSSFEPRAIGSEARRLPLIKTNLRKFGFRLWYLCGEAEVADDGRHYVVVVVRSDQDVLEKHSDLLNLTAFKRLKKLLIYERI